jgi:hypothetical protein
MEELIRRAFEHVEEIGPHVHSGHYDLIGPDSSIIVPSAWDTTIEPDMKITMHMWPLPEPKEEPPPSSPPPSPPPLDEEPILNLDDLLGPEPELKPKGEISTSIWFAVRFQFVFNNADVFLAAAPKAPKKPKPSGSSSWMLGGKPRAKPALKR